MATSNGFKGNKASLPSKPSRRGSASDAALKFNITFDTITYEEGLALMGPVRNPNENRPV